MRCKTHPSDPGAGVCACCLRERLSALGITPDEDDATPSTSIRKKTDSSSSPPEFTCLRYPFHVFVDQKTADYDSRGGGRRHDTLKFSLSSPIRGKQTPKKVEINAVILKPPASNFCHLAQILRRRMKNKKQSPNISSMAEDVSRGRSRKSHEPPVNGRGMSPVSNNEAEEARCELSTPSPLRKKVVVRKPHNTQMRQCPRKASTFALCLNPLVRPSLGPAQAALYGELRETVIQRYRGGGAVVPDASSTLVMNRSRKLADLGKAW